MTDAPLIRLLTGGDIVVDAHPPIVWSGRNGRELLALLCLSPGQRAARSYLAAVLWPDDEPAAGRHKLRMALLSLRNDLSTAGHVDLIRADNSAISLDLGEDELDLLQFERLSRMPSSTRRHACLDLYGGDLLGTMLGLSDSFEELLRNRRQYYREIALAVGISLLRELRGSEDPERFLQVLRTVLGIDPANEAAVTMAIEDALAKRNEAEALRLFADYSAALQRLYGAEPSGHLAELCRGLSNKSAPPPQASAVPPHQEPLHQVPQYPHAPTPRAARLPRMVWLVGLVTVAIFTALLLLMREDAGSPAVVRVYPVQLDTVDCSLDLTAEDIQRQLIGSLSSVDGMSFLVGRASDPRLGDLTRYALVAKGQCLGSRVRLVVEFSEASSQALLLVRQVDASIDRIGSAFEEIADGLNQVSER